MTGWFSWLSIQLLISAQGHEMELCVRYCTQWGVCPRFCLSFSLCLPLAPSLSFKNKQFFFKKRTFVKNYPNKFVYYIKNNNNNKLNCSSKDNIFKDDHMTNCFPEVVGKCSEKSKGCMAQDFLSLPEQKA